VVTPTPIEPAAMGVGGVAEAVVMPTPIEPAASAAAKAAMILFRLFIGGAFPLCSELLWLTVPTVLADC
jgi:hypothetical protein